MVETKAAGDWWLERDEGLGFTHAYRMQRVHREQSDYQEIEVYQHDALGRVLVLDGLVQASEADEFVYHEMLLHVPLLGRARETASVLIVGGGDGGALREALLHEFVERVVMVEIDERVIAVSNEYLGVQGDYDDPRVTLHCADAADYLADAARAGERFDVILLDLTEPVGPPAAPEPGTESEARIAESGTVPPTQTLPLQGGGLISARQETPSPLEGEGRGGGDSTAAGAPAGPSGRLFSDTFCRDLAACLAGGGVVVDSDSLFLTKDGPRYLQELCAGGALNLVNLMRASGNLPHISAYRSVVPVYPGGEFGFFLYSRDGHDYSAPAGVHHGRHYNPALHRASFALPTWWRDALGFA